MACGKAPDHGQCAFNALCRPRFRWRLHAACRHEYRGQSNALFGVSRVLRPSALFGIYDVMKVGDGDLTYPVPWATMAASSSVAEPEQYRRALKEAGLLVIAERSRRDFALAFFEQLRAKIAASDGPPPVGLHILMGRNTPDKVQNVIQSRSRVVRQRKSCSNSAGLGCLKLNTWQPWGSTPDITCLMAPSFPAASVA